MKILDIKRVEAPDTYYINFIVITGYITPTGVPEVSLAFWHSCLANRSPEENLRDICKAFSNMISRFCSDVSIEDIYHLLEEKARSKPKEFFGGLPEESLAQIKSFYDLKNELETAARGLPAVGVELADAPCQCPIGAISLMDAIMHLNDHHEWSRERIADWLDELHDSGLVDLEFKVLTD